MRSLHQEKCVLTHILDIPAGGKRSLNLKRNIYSKVTPLWWKGLIISYKRNMKAKLFRSCLFTIFAIWCFKLYYWQRIYINIYWHTFGYQSCTLSWQHSKIIIQCQLDPLTPYFDMPRDDFIIYAHFLLGDMYYIEDHCQKHKIVHVSKLFNNIRVSEDLK